MKKATIIIRWIGVTLFGIMAVTSLGTGGFLAAILFLLGGAIIAPLEPIQQLRGKLKPNKPISIVLSIVLLFAGSFAMPNSEIPTADTESSQISNTITKDTADTDNSSSTSKNTNSENTSKTDVDSSKEKTTSKDNTSSKKETTSKDNTSSKKEITSKPTTSSKEENISNNIPSSKPNPTTSTEPQSSANQEINSNQTVSTTPNTTTSQPIVSAENTPQNNNQQVVYTTENGSKYHSTKSCPSLSRSKVIYDTTVSEAVGRNLGPCSRCH